uniref:Uncharacterized protein n=1 Tax=Oryza meridionalis TaxID=40149 RepID=A0A0E0EDY1_9ORYZ
MARVNSCCLCFERSAGMNYEYTQRPFLEGIMVRTTSSPLASKLGLGISLSALDTQPLAPESSRKGGREVGAGAVPNRQRTGVTDELDRVPLLVPHHARENTYTVVAGYDVPAGARVLVNVWAIARDPASWPDRPDAFLPERFLPGAGGCDGVVDVHGQHFELLPFESGWRICPATNLAKKMVALGVASLLQGFA